jgi:alkanesulfonate monooxygenase SsuD/methylene tetrahydromethanopterin reductase-like flavin-dependent oxidoreductase (luciferase family)
MALRREAVAYQGEHFTLPLPDGPGKAIRLTVHPARASIPLYLAAVGPKNLQLTGEIADGWLAIFYSPEHAALSLDPLREGRRTSGRGTAENPLDGFDVVPTVPVVIADDVEAAAAPLRSYAALYIGGMGSREQNFYNALARRMGFEAEAERIQDLYLARQPRDAAAAVPSAFIDGTSLIGPLPRIRDRLQAYADAGVTTLTISPYAPTLEGRVSTLRAVAEAVESAGLAS